MKNPAEYAKSALSYLNYFGYSERGNKSSEESYEEKRLLDRPSITKSYYDLVTDFYEVGWGECFHFAPRHKGETLKESILRHEYYLCLKLGLTENDFVLDAGCGIMGPARNICRFTGASITGININRYQVERSDLVNAETSFSDRLRCVEGDFTACHFDNDTFDHIYSIEAFCHAPDRLAVFREMFRVLKPGGKLAFYDWVMTEKV